MPSISFFKTVAVFALVITKLLVLSGTINLSPDISYWKSNRVTLTFQSAYTTWIIGGPVIYIYGGGAFHGSGDCVSLKPNTTNALVENLYCQGSHGISVRSLGKYTGTQGIVENVLVKNVTMVDAENGVRIRAVGGSSSSTSTTGGGNSYAKNLTSQDFESEAVALPIVIDQCYETSDSTFLALRPELLFQRVRPRPRPRKQSTSSTTKKTTTTSLTTTTSK